MIERLDQLTIAQFVELICGNTKVLHPNHITVNPAKLASTTRALVLEYRAIADPGGTNAYFHHIEEWLKAKISVVVFTMCDNLASLYCFPQAREILTEYGIDTEGWKDKRVAGIIKASLAKSQRELQQLETDNEVLKQERENIRSQFDSQTATLMAHFRFQIDPETIKATLYANIVARHNREVKAQMAALKKK